MQAASTLRRCALVALLLCSATIMGNAQEGPCAFRNTAFKSGEFLTYNLYYNWKFAAKWLASLRVTLSR